MRTYNVKLAEGVFVRVNADNPEDAAAKAKAEIAKREGSRAYDKVYFDYETGIQNNALRAQLAVAEDFYRKDGEYVSERENVLNNFPGIGSSGYVRDSKGSLALTPAAQTALGLKPSNKNIVIDENKAFTSGDYADLAGYAGPVLGAIAAVNPYLRGVKWLRGALDSRVGRALLVGAGSGIGKAAEESNEIARGVQLQNEEEVGKMVKDEVILGTVAQGAAEVLGGIFKTYFGRTATNGNVRDSRFIMDGYDLGDVAKVDAQIAVKKNITDPNFKATRKEVLKEFKQQKIKPKFPRGIVTQAALGRTIPSRGQSIAEAVTGASAREKRASANLVAQMDDFFKSIGNADATIDDFISAGAVGKVAGQELKAATTAFDKAMNLSDQKLDQLLKKMLNEMNTVQGLGEVSGSALKRELMDSIGSSYKTWHTSKNKLYAASDKALAEAGAMPAIQNQVKAYSSVFKEILNRADVEDVLFKYQGKPVTYLKELAEGGNIENLEQLIKAQSEVKSLLSVLGQKGATSGTSYRVMKEVSEEINNLFKDIASGKAFLSKGAFAGVEGANKTAAMNAAKAFGKAKEEYKKGMQKFDNTIAQKVINDIKFNKGQGNPDEMFAFIDGPNNSRIVDQILSNIAPGQKDMFRGKMAKLLMQNVIKKSTDQTTGLLKPAQFSTNILKYEDTLRPLFGAKYEQNIQLLREITRLNPKINKKDLDNFFRALDEDPSQFVMAKPSQQRTRAQIEGREPDFFPGDKGFDAQKMIADYPELDTANVLLKTLRDKAVLAADAEKLSKSAFMKTVNQETPERIVASIFRPQSAVDINYLKNTLEPATFAKVRENALGQLLTDAVSVGSLKSTAKLTDIFKPNQFKNAMESYGDETLEAMFGKDQLLAFKAFQQSLDLQVGASKGLTAGGIVAGAIGAQALNISLLPTIVGLKVFANVMSNPKIVRLMARTDTSSTLQVIDAFEKALRLTAAQSIQEEAGQAEAGIMEELRKQVESPENQSVAEELRGQVEQIAKPIKASVPDLPDIIPANLSAQNQAPINRSLLGGNPANESIAESLGRLA
jgi:hypothetical protein